MAPSEVQASVRRLIDEAEQFRESELAERRAKATRYYKGEPFGANSKAAEQEGRSQFVTTDMRDAILAIMASLLRIFFGAEQPVEYAPHGPEDVKEAEQATDYISKVVLQQDNPGFLIFQSWFKDALARNPGVVKWWPEFTTKVRFEQATGITDDILTLMLMDENVTMMRVEDGPPVAAPGPDGQQLLIPTYNVSFRRTSREFRARFDCLPSEEVGWSKDARNPMDASVLYHRTEKTRSELIEMGIPGDVIDEHGGTDASLTTAPEKQARSVNQNVTAPMAVEPSQKRSLYVEAFARIDTDGDGIAEERKFCGLGPGFHIVNGDGLGEPVDERPFAFLVPDPEPHTIVGQDVGDWTMDIQLLNSCVIRAILDSLSQSIFGKTFYSEGVVNAADIMSPAISQPVRVQEGVPPANAAFHWAPDFHGAKALPMLEVIQEIKESRVGHPRGAGGINADALQSSTQSAIGLMATAKQERIEMIARIFAETGVKDLFKGLLRLITKHQDGPRMVRLRNEWTPVDPRAWNAEMDVQVNVALGGGLTEQKIAVLAGLAQKQELVLDKLGPSNPLFTLGHYRNTLAEALMLGGRRDISKFMGDVPTDWRPPPPPEQPDPAMLIAQAEVAKARAEVEKQAADVARERLELLQKQMQVDVQAAAKEQELALKRYEIDKVDDRERDKAAQEFELKDAEITARYNAQVDMKRLDAELERDRIQADKETRIQVAKIGKKVTIGKETNDATQAR
ncbi:MAG TPA: hypothetical protein VJS69_00465 [Candidatus Krumholzibacteria bacterium]|nr:hypothetical protein [Candidatus Krumholzibacteria bacterium]